MVIACSNGRSSSHEDSTDGGTVSKLDTAMPAKPEKKLTITRDLPYRIGFSDDR